MEPHPQLGALVRAARAGTPRRHPSSTMKQQHFSTPSGPARRPQWPLHQEHRDHRTLQPRSLRIAHKIVLGLVAALGFFLVVRFGFVMWFGSKAGSEIDSVAGMLNLTDELRVVLKLIGMLLVFDFLAPIVLALLLSSLGRRIRWDMKMAGKIVALVAFFALKPVISWITGRHMVDHLPLRVVEIDPNGGELFDSRSAKPLAGVVDDVDGTLKFYNFPNGVRPSDGRKIRPCTPEDVARWKLRPSP
jgi:hypothetical protein